MKHSSYWHPPHHTKPLWKFRLETKTLYFVEFSLFSEWVSLLWVGLKKYPFLETMFLAMIPQEPFYPSLWFSRFFSDLYL
jgi:hypothetical protein